MLEVVILIACAIIVIAWPKLLRRRRKERSYTPLPPPALRDLPDHPVYTTAERVPDWARNDQRTAEGNIRFQQHPDRRTSGDREEMVGIITHLEEGEYPIRENWETILFTEESLAGRRPEGYQIADYGREIEIATKGKPAENLRDSVIYDLIADDDEFQRITADPPGDDDDDEPFYISEMVVRKGGQNLSLVYRNAYEKQWTIGRLPVHVAEQAAAQGVAAKDMRFEIVEARISDEEKNAAIFTVNILTAKA